MIRQESLSKNKSKEIRALSIKKNRDKQGLFIAEGEKCVADLLFGFQPECLVATPQWAERNRLNFNFAKDVVLYIADNKTIASITTLVSPPEILAVFRKKEEKKDLPVLDPKKIYLLLDDIQDPGNLGTIIRTCDWFGIYDIFASEHTADIYNPKVVQATMGSLARVNVTYLDISKLLENNKELPVIGTMLNGKDIHKVEVTDGAFIILGNEGRGVSDKLKEKIDIPVTIPPVNLSQHPDSLNVGVANAIVLYHFTAR